MWHRLTPLAKGCICVVILGCAVAGVYFTGLLDGVIGGNGTSVVQEHNVSTINTPSQTPAPNLNTATTVDTLRISLDEWVGWKPLLDANGGLTTQPGSIYHGMGLNIEFVIVNDADISSNLLITGGIHGAGYTINRYAFLFDQFVDNGINPVYIFTLYTSSGGDGVVARQEFTSIESLYYGNARIGVARFSESMTLVDWLINQSSLIPEQRQTLKDNLIMFDTPDEAAIAFFAGRLDAAATWQPYLFQAQESPGTHLLFDTRHATNLIPGGLVFDYAFVQANEAALVALVQGAIQAYETYLSEMGALRSAMPMFSLESDSNIREMAADATLFTARDMIDHMQGPAQSLFAHMSDIWAARGESANRDNAEIAFTDRIVRQLDVRAVSDVEEGVLVAAPVFTAEDRETVEAQREQIAALITMRADIRFEPNTAIILEESISEIERFFQAAQLLDGAIMVIEGNIANVSGHEENTPAGLALSYERAQQVARQLQLRGIDPNRFIVVGNGISNQIGDNATEAGRILNRRTDISFVILE